MKIAWRRQIAAVIFINSRSQSPRCPKRRSTVARLLRFWIRIPPGVWMSVCCECCILSGTALCDGLITGPEESYRLWCVVVCDLETSWMRRPWPPLGQSATGNKWINDINKLTPTGSSYEINRISVDGEVRQEDVVATEGSEFDPRQRKKIFSCSKRSVRPWRL